MKLCHWFTYNLLKKFHRTTESLVYTKRKKFRTLSVFCFFKQTFERKKFSALNKEFPACIKEAKTLNVMNFFAWSKYGFNHGHLSTPGIKAMFSKRVKNFVRQVFFCFFYVR